MAELKTKPTGDAWPPLAFASWADTCGTLHLWTQIVGKVRLARTPWINHSWHVVLYPTARGLTTSPIPHGRRSFDIDFDFVDHQLVVSTSDGGRATMELRPRTVADFYRGLMDMLGDLDLRVRIHGAPNEVAEAIPFARDEVHGAYHRGHVERFARVLSSSSRVLQDFRADFVGKCSPVHFFWGGFDLAVTRFSGRPAPPHPGGVPNLPVRVSREAYSQEVSSAGFWPGADWRPEALFYSYAYPTPEGFAEAEVRPAAARWDDDLGEFVLPYEAVRTSATPEADLAAFLLSTYEAAADRAGWERQRLEWGPQGRPDTNGRSGVGTGS